MKSINISPHKLFLDLQNPRQIGGFPDQKSAIQYLVTNCKIHRLALDMIENGLSPVEKFALLQHSDNAFYVIEGNRRLCAVKLLLDPELAPTAFKKRFKNLTGQIDSELKIDAVILDNREQADIWLDRIHKGNNQGLGRLPWSIEAKESRKSASLPLTLMELAQEMGLLDNTTRKGKLTLFKDYFTNEDFKSAIGVDLKDNKLEISTSREAFDMNFSELVQRMASKDITTRKNRSKEEIEKLASSISSKTPRAPTTTIRELPEPIVSPRPDIPPSPTKLPKIEELSRAFGQVGNAKLNHLYHSLCTISAASHTTLSTIGLWTLFECLTKLEGRKSEQRFKNYLNMENLKSRNFDREQVKTYTKIIDDLYEYGNIAKHDSISTRLNHEQLINDFSTISPLLLDICYNSVEKK